MKIVAERWREPDEGIWEVRGGAQHFTHSKLMAWVAADRAVRSVEKFGLDGPLEEWRHAARRDPARTSSSTGTTRGARPSPSTTDPRSWTRRC